MRVIFTCGGTAGHVNPALAAAQIFSQKHPDCEILFVGAERGMEIRLVEQAGYPIRTVDVSTIERAGGWRFLKHNVKSILKVPASRHQAAAILKEFKPDLVVGTGGYASFPAVSEAARRGIPCAIHESNAYPGFIVRFYLWACLGCCDWFYRAIIPFLNTWHATTFPNRALHGV